MKTSHAGKFAAGFTAFALVCSGSLLLDKKVAAAGSGSITGTVKLNGTAPHMKGIDMSKDPYCTQQHTGEPPKMENVVVASDGGLQNVVLYITDGLQGAEASAVPSDEPKFDQKGCMYIPHVLVVDAGQKFQVVTSDQTTHNIHPLPAPGSGNIGWNKSQPPGAPPIVSDWKAAEAISVKCNIHPWMHGWHVVVKGPLRHHRWKRQLHTQRSASGLLHGHRVAGRVRNPDTKGDCCCWSTREGRFRVQSEVKKKSRSSRQGLTVVNP